MKTCGFYMRCGLVLALAAFGGCSSGPPAVAPVPLPPLDVSSTAPLAAAEYRLQPGDVLRVKFLYHPELDVKLPVRPDGNITLQATGEIRAQGLTAEQLADVVRDRSSDRLRDPEVTVIVAELGDEKVYVGGEVRQPGFVAFRRGLTPLQAILDRGGFTDTARLDSVVRITAEQNDYHATRIDFSQVLEGKGDAAALAANDVIYVPRTFIGDMNTVVSLYVHRLLPIPPRVGVGFAP